MSEAVLLCCRLVEPGVRWGERAQDDALTQTRPETLDGLGNKACFNENKFSNLKKISFLLLKHFD